MCAKPLTPHNLPPDARSSALRAMIRTAQGGFSKPLRIERAEGKLQVVLGGTVAGAGQSPTAPDCQVALMCADLKAHLDRREGTRAALRHLSVVEHELAKRGMRIFDDMPLPVLQRAAGQLNGLAEEPLLEGFVLLQARLDVAIVEREERVHAETPAKRLAASSFLVTDKLQVTEASMSDFIRIAGEVRPFES